MTIDRTELRIRIETALNHLAAALNGKNEKIEQMSELFIAETPEQVEQLQLLISGREWLRAAALLHKLKTRFSYFGMDDLAADLARWEDRLRNSPYAMDTQEDARQLSVLKQLTGAMVEEIKVTPYYPKEKAAAADLPLAGKVVLVAEDDEINALVIELFVQELGGKVIKALNGSEAVRLTLEKGPDLVIMDVHMPFYSGLEAIRDLRRRGVRCPIVSLSASTRLNERQNCLDCGANDFIQKPADRDTVSEALLRHLLPGR